MAKLKISQKNWLAGIMFLIAIIILANIIISGQFSFFEGVQVTTVASCSSTTGCTLSDLDRAYDKIDEIERQSGGVTECSLPWISCGSLIKGKDSNFDLECVNYNNFGNLVEFKSECDQKIVENPQAKTVCGTTQSGTILHVFNDRTLNYPTEKQFDDLDVYYLSTFDNALISTPKQRCNNGCVQVSSTKAECVTLSNTYTKLDHKGCFAVSSRVETWWFDSNNQISQFVSVCEQGCEDGECISFDSGTGTNTDTSPETIINKDCGEFFACASDVSYTCSDGTKITTYSCNNNCATPSNEICPDGTSPVSVCEAYQKTNLDGSCEFSIERTLTFNAIKKIILDNLVIVMIIVAIILIMLAYLITRPNNRKVF